MEDEESDAEDMPLSDGEAASSGEEEDNEIYSAPVPASPGSLPASPASLSQTVAGRGQQQTGPGSGSARERSPEAYAPNSAQALARKNDFNYQGPPLPPAALRQQQVGGHAPSGWHAVASEGLFATFWSLSIQGTYDFWLTCDTFRLVFSTVSLIVR